MEKKRKKDEKVAQERGSFVTQQVPTIMGLFQNISSAYTMVKIITMALKIVADICLHFMTPVRNLQPLI